VGVVRLRRLAWANADYISGAVDPDIFEPDRLECLADRSGASTLFEWRRRNLTQSHLIGEHLRLIPFDSLQRGAHCRIAQQLATNLRGRLLQGIVGGSRSVVQK